VRIVAADAIDLQRGAVYVESAGGRRVTVRTAAGEVYPTGTRFEARAEREALQVRVREGSVAVDRGSAHITASAGEAITIRGNAVTRSRIAADDPSWNWTLRAVTLPEIEGRTLHEVLVWIAHERGWRLQYTGDTEASSRTAVLHGSVRGLTIDEALRTVVLSAGLEHRVADGVLTLGK
jgi:ferric-dicitrate binding protein FerR (iron transport regulator)